MRQVIRGQCCHLRPGAMRCLVLGGRDRHRGAHMHPYVIFVKLRLHTWIVSPKASGACFRAVGLVRHAITHHVVELVCPAGAVVVPCQVLRLLQHCHVRLRGWKPPGNQAATADTPITDRLMRGSSTLLLLETRLPIAGPKLKLTVLV